MMHWLYFLKQWKVTQILNGEFKKCFIYLMGYWPIFKKSYAFNGYMVTHYDLNIGGKYAAEKH